MKGMQMSENGTGMVSGMLLGLLAETAIHVGIGQADGAIDLPVAREGGTDLPHVPGAGVKGALREACETSPQCQAKANRWFGASSDENAAGGGAGEILVGDIRLLLLPVRSLTGFYKWLTCPYLIERFGRDRARLGLGNPVPVDWDALGPQGSYKILSQGGEGEKIYLEERLFEVAGPPPQELLDLLGSTIANEAARQQRLKDQLAIVSDEDFSWFARNALPVAAHNSLEDGTKISQALWYEETLPPDTVMTLVILDRNGKGTVANAYNDLFGKHPYLRVGGNETVGQGWFRICKVEEVA